jgi:hypothetical protein
MKENMVVAPLLVFAIFSCFVAIFVLGGSSSSSSSPSNDREEHFAHYPPYREANFRNFGNAYASEALLKPSIRIPPGPSSGVDIFGARYSTVERPFGHDSYVAEDTPSLFSLREGYIDHTLDPDGSVPKHVAYGSFTDENEIRPKERKYQSYSKFRDPMVKDCMDRDRNKYPLWPVSYEYPYRDP